MTIDTKVLLTKIDGEPLTYDDKPEKQLVLGEIISNTLSSDIQSKNPHMSYQLAQKFATNESVEVTSDEIVFIKEALTRSGRAPLVTGQIIGLLEK